MDLTSICARAQLVALKPAEFMHDVVCVALL